LLDERTAMLARSRANNPENPEILQILIQT
jgi:hypothetical protein